MNPYDKLHELARAIRDSETFGRVFQAKQRVESDASSLQMVQDFRRRQFELEAKQMMGQTITDSEQEMLRKLAEVIELNRDVREYLQSEFQLSMFFADVQKVLGELVKEAMLPDPTQSEGEM